MSVDVAGALRACPTNTTLDFRSSRHRQRHVENSFKRDQADYSDALPVRDHNSR
jgi:hypothetical protein